MSAARITRGRSSVSVLVLGWVMSSGGASAQEATPRPAEFASGIGLLTASPVALGAGRVLGASGDISWTWSLLEVGGRIQLGRAQAFDELFKVSHTEGRLLVDAGVFWRFGRGRFGLGAQVGTVVIREQRVRQQAPRLEALGIDTTSSGFSVGPLIGLVGRVDVRVFHRFDLRIEVGPTAGWAGFEGSTRRTLGWSGVLQARFTP